MARSATTFVKGEKSRKQGRPKGSPNKLTREFRETVQKLLDENRDNVSRWNLHTFQRTTQGFWMIGARDELH